LHGSKLSFYIAGWVTALENIVDDVNGIADVYLRIAVGIARIYRHRFRTKFKDIIDQVDRINYVFKFGPEPV
jgi:hypothetical protein